MKNELIVGVITALLAGAALFSYNAQLNNNELAQFEEFKTTYGKIYTLEENVYRFGVFITNLKKINQHNADKTQTYTMGVNQFTDMTNEEFAGKDYFNDRENFDEKYCKLIRSYPCGRYLQICCWWFSWLERKRCFEWC